MSFPSRRQFLGGVGGLGVSLAGCLGSTAPGSETIDAGAGTATRTRQTPYPGPVRCRGDPVAVERRFTDSAGYGDDIEYFPENKTVRFVATRRGDDPVSYDTWSFEEWAAIKAASVGLERVRDATATRLGTDEFGSGWGQPPDSVSVNTLVIKLHVATWIEDGQPISTPTVPLSRLADVAPRSANVTVSLEGDTSSQTVPVFANHVEAARL